MKRIYYPLVTSLLCCSVIVSCSDDNLAEQSSTAIALLDSNKDLTYGNNLVIAQADSLKEQLIPLNVSSPVEVESHNGIVSFDCVKKDGKYYLSPKMLQKQTEPSVLDKVTIKVPGNDSYTKELYVSVREPSIMTRSTNDTEEALKHRVGQIFRNGVFPSYGIGEMVPRYLALDPVVENYVQPIYSFQPQTVFDETSANSIEEANEKWGLKIGVNNIPVGSAGTVSGSLGYTSETSKKYNYQYYIRTRNYECAAASIDIKMDSIGKYLSPNLNRILNTEDYDKELYPNTPEGIYNILDHYGLYLPTYCILGARATYILSKKQDLETSSSSWAAEITGSINKGKKKAEDILNLNEDQLAAYKYASEGAPSASASFNYSNSELAQQTDMSIKFTLIGGNYATAKSTEEFSAGSDPANWAALAYSGKGQKAELYPLYDLVVDKNSTRYKMLKQYIDGDSKSIEAYYKHRKEFLEKPEATHWVLAGLMLRVCPNGTDIAPIKAKCADGVERIFYPMTFNRYPKRGGAYNVGDQGKVFDSQNSAFGRCVRRRMHVWYYALALHSDCPGIKGIRFVEDGKEYTGFKSMMPQNANTGDGWQCSTDDYVLVVDPIDKNDKTTTPITSFALTDDEGNVLASSGGTEYGESPMYSKNFKSFWLDKENEKYRTRNGAKNPTKCGIYLLHWIHQPDYLNYMYSTQPLLLDHKAENNYQIEHPINMRKSAY